MARDSRGYDRCHDPARESLQTAYFEARGLGVNDSEKRLRLLRFLDERVFRPILDSPPSLGPDAVFFREAQNRVRNTWIRYPEKYQTATAVRAAFISDLH